MDHLSSSAMSSTRGMSSEVVDPLISTSTEGCADTLSSVVDRARTNKRFDPGHTESSRDCRETSQSVEPSEESGR